MSEEIIGNEVYVHKTTGKQYQVVEFGRMESTHEPVVIYKAVNANEYTTCWVRPYKEFREKFERVSDVAHVQ